ncbi:MAG TPA: CGNR zinc finger domain-containing protein [Gemmatimonadales bacterium]|nr:CGNR zinc finger domain-containing protein [Gemmatimonadales bacterium]
MPQESSGIPCIDFINKADHGDRYSSRAREFRVVLERMLRAEAQGVGATDADLDTLNDLLSRAAGLRGITPAVRGYGWGWRRDPGSLLVELFPVAWSAAAVLTSADRHRLKLCDGCGLLFLDQSRNRSRRWCDMRSCGNRHKQQGHRKRGKER